jgi:RecA-family ATPase
MRLINYNQMKDMPSVAWLAQDYIPAAALVLLWAQEESFKSFIAVDLACAVATGVPWLGCVPINDPGPVVYIAAEGRRGIRTRVDAWMLKKYRGKKTNDIWVVDQPVHADEAADLGDFIDRARIVPRMVVIDTYSRCLGGENENDTGTAERFLAAYDKLRHKYDCTLLFIHHSDKYGNVPRGAYAFMAAMEAQYRVLREDNAMTAVVSCRKMKDAERPETITVLAEQVEDSLVLRKAER